MLESQLAKFSNTLQDITIDNYPHTILDLGALILPTQHPNQVLASLEIPNNIIRGNLLCQISNFFKEMHILELFNFNMFTKREP